MRFEWEGKARPAAVAGGLAPEPAPGNWLIEGDNKLAIAALAARERRPKLVYIDPPFATGTDFGDYNDAWPGLDAYLQMLYERLVPLHALLADDGAIVLHLDWHAAPYARLLLDEVFGRESFRNEIVWAYRRWPAKQRAFQRLHDTLLYYVKDPSSYTWNQLYEPLSPGTIRTHGDRKQLAVFEGDRRVNSVDTDERSPGSPMTDVWPISILNARAKERTGYATQKPEALLERIIRATTDAGDLVADVFCGSGTTLAAAHKLGRVWIGCDVSERAVGIARERLLALGARFEVVHAVEPAVGSRFASGRAGSQPVRGSRSLAVQH